MAIKLSDIYRKLLEQFPMPGMTPGMPLAMPGALGANVGASAKMQPTAGQPPPVNAKNIVELVDVNTVISMFPSEKKLVFSPQEHTAYTKKLKLYVDVLKQNFMIDSINLLDEGVFEVVLDPRESFESVVQFLQPQQEGSNVQQG